MLNNVSFIWIILVSSLEHDIFFIIKQNHVFSDFLKEHLYSIVEYIGLAFFELSLIKIMFFVNLKTVTVGFLESNKIWMKFYDFEAYKFKFKFRWKKLMLEKNYIFILFYKWKRKKMFVSV